jgi:hypothetical protein
MFHCICLLLTVDPDAEVTAVVSNILRVWNHLQQPLCIVRHLNETQWWGEGLEGK